MSRRSSVVGCHVVVVVGLGGLEVVLLVEGGVDVITPGQKGRTTSVSKSGFSGKYLDVVELKWGSGVVVLSSAVSKMED